MATNQRVEEPSYAPARDLVRRSMLAGAVTSEEHVDTAWMVGADAIMLDLEDTVPAFEKERARSLVRAAIASAARGGGDILVRINGPWELAQDDLEASVWPGLATIILPKVESVDELQRADDAITSLQRKRGLEAPVRLALTIESVAGLLRARELARATPRIVSITVGTEDYARDIDVEPTAEGAESLLAQQQLIVVARDAQISPLMGVLGALAGVGDLPAVRRRARWAREIGFRGAACSARGHVSIANDEFRPAPEAVDGARRVIEAYEEASARGDGRIEFGGGVVDTPVVLRAQRLIERAEQIDEFDGRKQATLRAAGVFLSDPPPSKPKPPSRADRLDDRDGVSVG